MRKFDPYSPSQDIPRPVKNLEYQLKMKLRTILAIDPGMRNLAHCLMEGGNVLSVGRSDIFNGERITVTGVYAAIQRWCHDNKALIDRADVVVIERQFCDAKATLSACLLVIQTVIQTHAHGKGLVVHAMTVKRAFGTCTGAHKTNKQASVEKVRNSYPAIAEVVKSGGRGNDKLDDMCDAVLMCQWLLTRSAQELHFLMDRLE